MHSRSDTTYHLRDDQMLRRFFVALFCTPKVKYTSIIIYSVFEIFFQVEVWRWIRSDLIEKSYINLQNMPIFHRVKLARKSP